MGLPETPDWSPGPESEHGRFKRCLSVLVIPTGRQSVELFPLPSLSLQAHCGPEKAEVQRSQIPQHQGAAGPEFDQGSMGRRGLGTEVDREGP